MATAFRRSHLGVEPVYVETPLPDMLASGQVTQVENQMALEDLRRAAERAGYYPVMTPVLAWVQRKKTKGSGGPIPKGVIDNAHRRQHAFSSTISRYYEPRHPLGKSKPLMRFCNLNASTHGYLYWWHQIFDPKRHTKYHHDPEYWDGYMGALEGRRRQLELALRDSQALQEDEVMPMHRDYWGACLDVSQHVLRGYQVSEVGSVLVH